MNDFEIQVAGKLSALEFVLEVMMANELVRLHPDQSDTFKSDMMDRKGFIKNGPIDAEVMQQISRSLSENLQNFLDKVTKREADIRSKLD